MAIRAGLFRTRVARRVLLLFFIGALLPVVVMGAISLVVTRNQLESGAEDQVKSLANTASQSVVQQLLLAQGGLARVRRIVARGEVGAEAAAALPPSMDGVALRSAGGAPRVVAGDPGDLPALDAADRATLAKGEMLVLTPKGSGQVLAVLALDSARAGAGVLWARLKPDSVWGQAEQFTAIKSRADFCVLGPEDAVLFCHSGTPGVANAFRRAQLTGIGGTFRARVEGQDLITGYRQILLANMGAARWTMLVSESAASVLAPLSVFSYSFPIALLLALAAVLLLANVLVRKTMEPLAALEDGTRRISGGDLDARVPVTSTDEFGTVAGSFNRMAGHLALTFHQIETGRAIDQAVLTARSADEAVSAVLDHFAALVPSQEVGVLVVDYQDGERARLRSRNGEGSERAVVVSVGPKEREWLRSEPAHRVVVGSSDELDTLAGSPHSDRSTARVVFPLLTRESVLGALWYEPPSGLIPAGEDVDRARQVADQATVALDELRLMAELEDLNWGTLRALARAIDAKSEWTAGHSERVAQVAMDIARAMGFGDAEVDILHRGTLLHDIGKIGVPAKILDWPSKLSDEDRKVMNNHPAIGARILEPIRAFRPMLPIVRSHHERWDGRGYPDGLAGEEIHPLARVVAVADVYDAMVSERPYRDSLSPESALTHIQSERGTHFDPRVVDAFTEMISRRLSVVATHE